MESNNSLSRLHELRGSGYEIVDGEPDIIGWTIRDTGGRKLGVVHDLLFEPEPQKVRYIVANLKDNDFDLDRRKVLIPIGLAELQQDSDNVVIDSISAWQIRALPSYDKHMSDQDEQDIYAIFAGTHPTLMNNTAEGRQQMYNHANYNYDNLFRNRRKDKTVQQPFSIRQREGSSLDNLRRDYDREDELEYSDQEAMAVRNNTENYNRENYNENDRIIEQGRRERLMEKIKHMKDDLNEIEKDLRNRPDF